MSLRSIFSRTSRPTTRSRARNARSLERALQHPLTPASREELLFLMRQ